MLKFYMDNILLSVFFIRINTLKKKKKCSYVAIVPKMHTYFNKVSFFGVCNFISIMLHKMLHCYPPGKIFHNISV